MSLLNWKTFSNFWLYFNLHQPQKHILDNVVLHSTKISFHPSNQPNCFLVPTKNHEKTKGAGGRTQLKKQPPNISSYTHTLPFSLHILYSLPFFFTRGWHSCFMSISAVLSQERVKSEILWALVLVIRCMIGIITDMVSHITHKL